MDKIPTGFKLKPLVGALNKDQLLARYLKTEHFLDLLKNESLWFTKIHNWQSMDPCEAELLPVFKKHIRSLHKNEYEYNFHESVVSLSLRSNFGCCFSLYKNENDHMWQVFTPENKNYGVIIIFKADALYEALLRKKILYPHQYLAKVKYITDITAKNMKPSDCIHSNKKMFFYEDSHFLKRIAFSNEKEVRAVISLNENDWTTLLHQFIPDKNIPYHPINATRPKDCRIGIKMKNSDLIYCSDDKVIFLNQKQGEEFVSFIKNHSLNNISNGIHMPFDISCIQKIIIHPRLKETDKTYNAILSEIKNKKLNCPVSVSNLYKESW